MQQVARIPYVPGVGIHRASPHRSIHILAGELAEAAWRGKGVRVFAWPCGTVAWAQVGTSGDQLLLRRALPWLIGTWARGATYGAVLADLRAARAPA